MIGHLFTQYNPPPGGGSNFEQMLQLFLELLTYTGGDVAEALRWMTQMDERYGFTTEEYGMGDFIEDLKEKGYIEAGENDGVMFRPTGKTGQVIRRKSLEEIFGKLKKASRGDHRTPMSGTGDEWSSDRREFDFGDDLEQIDMTSSLQNSQINHGIDDFILTEKDLVIQEREFKTQTATVLMIDISHSMVLYGEDRITPAKKVAMALAELIRTRYPRDFLDIVVFGNEARVVDLKDLPYLQVGPYHTNTCAGLELGMKLLSTRKTPNKQIFMITDGKPTCIREGNGYYKNSFGLDRKIVNRTLRQAARCRKLGISITTFMIATDPYLQRFVSDFTRINRGRAFYARPDRLGEFLFEDYIRNRKKFLH